MLEMLDSEFVKFARSKGVPAHTVVWKHAFRNTLIVPVTYAGLILAAFTTGTVVVETVFGWPGIGRLAVTASTTMTSRNERHGPVVTLMYLVVNFIVDISYALNRSANQAGVEALDATLGAEVEFVHSEIGGRTAADKFGT